MPNTYIQVMRTYFQQPFSTKRRSCVISGILFFFALFFFISGFSEKHMFLTIHLSLFIILFAYWAIHVKEQLTDTRASMTPNFRKVHGVVATIVAFVFVILLPGVIAPLVGWQSPGFVSISTLLFGIILWVILLGIIRWAILHLFLTSVLLLAAGWIILFYEPIRDGIEQIVLGNHPVLAFIIIIIGAILSITGIVRLFLLDEDYLNLKIPIDIQSISSLQWQQMEKSIARKGTWYVRNMIRHACNAKNSHWSRMRRWNISEITSSFNSFKFSLPVILLLPLWAVIPRVVRSMDVFTHTDIDAVAPIILFAFLPAFNAVVWMHSKFRFLSRDLMMPVSRSSYLKQLGMSFAISQFGLWVYTIGLFIFLWIFVMPTHRLGFLIHSITYSGLIQIWMFGLAVWLLSYRSFIITLLVMYIAIIPTATPICAFYDPALIQWRSNIIIFANFLAVIGLLLTWRGYRRWMVADFD